MQRVAAPELKAAVRAAVESRGVAPSQAADVAEALVETSLLGIDTHGIRLLDVYLRELDGGRANPTPRFRIQSRLPAVAVFDADGALGTIAAAEAMREAMSRAKQFGIAAVAVSNSNHFGAAGCYARMAARNGQIGLSASNSDALVTPHNGIAALNGTNPIAMAAPGLEDDGFFLDMATSQIAFSRVMSAGGGPTTVPPLGGYKGQGLGTMVQILSALLTSMPFDADLTHLYAAPFDAPRRVAHFVAAIEIDAFVPPGEFRARVSELLDRFRATPPTGGQPVVNAGDLERQERIARLRNGIPLSEREWATIEPYLTAASCRPA